MSTRPARWSAFRRAAAPASRSRAMNRPSLCASRTSVMSVGLASIGSIHPPNPPARGLEEQGHEEDDEDEVALRQHGAVTDIGAVAILTEYEARHSVRRPAGPACCDVDHDVGKLELEDDPDDDGGDADRQHQRE